VLLVDLDPQTGLTTSLGYEAEEFDTTIYDCLINSDETTLQKVILASHQSLSGICVWTPKQGP